MTDNNNGTRVRQSISVESADANKKDNPLVLIGPDAQDVITIAIGNATFRVRGADLREAIRRLS